MENDEVPEFSLLRDSINDSQVRSCMSVTPVLRRLRWEEFWKVQGVQSLGYVVRPSLNNTYMCMCVCVMLSYIHIYITYIA